MFSLIHVAAPAVAGSDPTRTWLDVPRADVVMGDDIAHTDWSTRLAHPSDEGQFEILVRKSGTPILAPGCHSQYLVIRMPASVALHPDRATEQAAARKHRFYSDLLANYESGKPLHVEVFAGPYGKREKNGRLVLSQCNLFFVEPSPPH